MRVAVAAWVGAGVVEASWVGVRVAVATWVGVRVIVGVWVGVRVVVTAVGVRVGVGGNEPLPVVNLPRTVFHESFDETPVNTSVKSRPSELNHLLEKFQKKVVASILGVPNPLSKRTVVQGPQGSDES